MVPRSIGEAFATNNLAQLVLITVALGIGLSKLRDEQRASGETSYRAVVDLLTVGFELLMKVLLWVVALVPLAVFGVVAISLAREGVGLFLRLGWFIAAVLIGLGGPGRLVPGRAGDASGDSARSASSGGRPTWSR